MSTVSWMVCKAFLAKQEDRRQAALLPFLSQHRLEGLRDLPPTFQDASKGFSAPLAKIDPSWFEQFLRSQPKSEISLFLAALTDSQASALKERLLYANHLFPLTKHAKRFLQKNLLEQIVPHDILPVECLPESPLNSLLTIEPKKLKKLCQLLGLHDLAFELQKVIDTKHLKQVQALLPKDEFDLLKKFQKEKDLSGFARLNLDQYKGDLIQLLFTRGLNRLAKALHGENSSLIWHITRRMDREDANTLTNLSSPLEQKGAHALLTAQVVEITSYLQEKP